MPEFTSYAHGTPCWVDVTSPELDRSIEFYEGLFGWEAHITPQPEAGGYTMFTLKDKYVAAASPPQEERSASYWTTYLASDDVDDTAKKIRDAGGTLFMDPFDRRATPTARPSSTGRPSATRSTRSTWASASPSVSSRSTGGA
jgi:uncharacterized protein